jgi:hypothetical protein
MTQVDDVLPGMVDWQSQLGYFQPALSLGIPRGTSFGFMAYIRELT